jgi:hypothetical protein
MSEVMRWGRAVAALGLGMVSGAGWMLWIQREEIRTFVAQTVVAPRPHLPDGNIPLMVQQERGVMRLRWSSRVAAIRDAAHGTLTIVDGAHRSRLDLDGRELRAGLASYWPDGSRVGFRLETDSGASGYIEAPVVDANPAKAAAEPKVERPPRPAPARRRPKPSAGASRGKPIDDGLEWTEHPRKASRLARLKQKMAFWRRPDTEPRP